MWPDFAVVVRRGRGWQSSSNTTRYVQRGWFPGLGVAELVEAEAQEEIAAIWRSATLEEKKQQMRDNN